MEKGKAIVLEPWSTWFTQSSYFAASVYSCVLAILPYKYRQFMLQSQIIAAVTFVWVITTFIMSASTVIRAGPPKISMSKGSKHKIKATCTQELEAQKGSFSISWVCLSVTLCRYYWVPAILKQSVLVPVNILLIYSLVFALLGIQMFEMKRSASQRKRANKVRTVRSKMVYDNFLEEISDDYECTGEDIEAPSEFPKQQVCKYESYRSLSSSSDHGQSQQLVEPVEDDPCHMLMELIQHMDGGSSPYGRNMPISQSCSDYDRLYLTPFIPQDHAGRHRFIHGDYNSTDSFAKIASESTVSSGTGSPSSMRWEPTRANSVYKHQRLHDIPEDDDGVLQLLLSDSRIGDHES